MQLAALSKSHQLVINLFTITLLHCNILYTVLALSLFAEMISSDHGTAEITHFLNKWVLTCSTQGFEN